MRVLIKKCKIIDPNSKYHLKTMDVLIEKGRFTQINKNISEPKANIIEGQSLHISPSWIDVGTRIGEPGFEHRETLTQSLDAALKGGFGTICVLSSKENYFDNAGSLSLIKEKTKDHIVDCKIISALSENLEGKEMAELLDMETSGAIAFGDGVCAKTTADLLKRGFLYLKKSNGIILFNPTNKKLSPNGQMHEGVVSTSLGLNAIPTVSEIIAIDEAIAIKAYTDGNLLLHLLSAKESVAKIKKEKKVGNLYCSVSYHNLIESDASLDTFDVNRKVLPPLRDEKDKDALIKAVNTDTIDIICSNHIALDQESKLKEFPYAEFGALGLQTCGVACLEILSSEVIVEKMAINPRKIFNLPESTIALENDVSITIWDAEKPFTFKKKDISSNSGNSPFVESRYKSTIVGIIQGNDIALNNS